MSRSSLVRLGFLAILWGSGFMLIKVALEGMGPIELVFARLLAAAIVMLALVPVQRHRLPHEPTTWLNLGIMAIITNIAPYFLFAVAEQHITSSLAGVINATTPLFTLLMAVALRMERPSAIRFSGLLVGLISVTVLTIPSSGGGLRGTIPGIVHHRSAFYGS